MALKPAAASASTGRSRSGGRPFPGQRRPREPIAAAELAAGGWGWGTGRGERGARAVPPPARGRGREAAEAAETRPGAGGWVADSPERPVGPCAQQQEDGGKAGGQQPSRPAWGASRAGRSVSPSFLPPPLVAGGGSTVRCAAPLAPGPAPGRHSLLRTPHQVLALCLHPPRRRTFK